MSALRASLAICLRHDIGSDRHRQPHQDLLCLPWQSLLPSTPAKEVSNGRKPHSQDWGGRVLLYIEKSLPGAGTILLEVIR